MNWKKRYQGILFLQFFHIVIKWITICHINVISSFLIAMSRLGLLCILIEEFTIFYSDNLPKIYFDHTMIIIVMRDRDVVSL